MGVLHLLAQAVGMTTPTGEVLPDALIMLGVTYAATWGLATLCYHTIEEPFLQLRRGYGARKPAPLAAVPDTGMRGWMAYHGAVEIDQASHACDRDAAPRMR